MLTTSGAECLRVAKKDSFDSVLALNRARAVSYDANADESRYLADPQRADQYEKHARPGRHDRVVVSGTVAANHGSSGCVASGLSRSRGRGRLSGRTLRADEPR